MKGVGIMANISNAVNMSFRVDKSLKQQADELFKNLGMNTSVALNMFLTQSVREQGLPFTPNMLPTPNQELLESLLEAEEIRRDKNRKGYSTVDDVIKALDEE